MYDIDVEKQIASWSMKKIDAAQGENPSALNDLINQKSAIIVLKNLLDASFIEQLKNRVQACRAHIETRHYVNGALTTLGPYLAKYLHSTEEYFARANDVDMLKDAHYDYIQHIQAQLKRSLGLDSLQVAKQPNGQLYAPGIVRFHTDGVANPLHNDNIMRDAASTDLVLKELKVQLSCIVCIQECDQGGELVHYKKRWEPADELYKIVDGLGYEEELVDQVERSVFKPETGDVYLIDPTHYHEILRVGGQDRLTLGFFIGFFDKNLKNGVVWS